MPTAFQSVNQGASERGQGYRDIPTHQDSGGGALAGLGNVIGNVGNVVGAFTNASANKERSASQGALSNYEGKLTKIYESAATDPSMAAKAEKQAEVARAEFAANYPELVSDGNSAYKRVTGRAIGEATTFEKAEIEDRKKSVESGYGFMGASDEHNAEQYERFQTERQIDAITSRQLKETKRKVEQGDADMALFDQQAIKGLVDMGRTKYEAAQSDGKAIIETWQKDPSKYEELVMAVQERMRGIKAVQGRTGKYAETPQANGIVDPIMSEWQAVLDVMSNKIKVEDYKNISALSNAKSEAIFLANPRNQALVTASKLMPEAVGQISEATEAVTNFLSAPLEYEDRIRSNPSASIRPVDTTEITDKDRANLQAIVSAGAKATSSPEAKAELAGSLESIIEHMDRNGMDYTLEDMEFITTLINTDGAMDLLDKRQSTKVAETLAMHASTKVDPVAKRTIVNPQPVRMSSGVFSPATSERWTGVKSELTDVKSMATVKVQDGVIYWELNDAYRTNRHARNTITNLNKEIAKSVTPFVSAYSKAMGISTEEAATTFGVPMEEKEGEVGKTSNSLGSGNNDRGNSGAPANGGSEGSGGSQGGKASGGVKDVLGMRESSNDYTAENSLGYVGKYQFGGGALQDLGYKKGGEWTGKDGINSKEDFLASPEAQESAMDAWVPILKKRIKSYGLDAYIGEEFEGVVVTEDGLVAASHLVGAKGVKDMFDTGVVPEDANQTKATEYLRLGGGGG